MNVLRTRSQERAIRHREIARAARVRDANSEEPWWTAIHPAMNAARSARPAVCCAIREARSIKILHVIVGLHTGGAESMLCKLLERSDGERFQHCVVSLLRGGSLRARAFDAAARVYELGWQRNRLSMAAAARLVRLMREEHPDVVQGWMYHGNAAATVMHLGSLRRAPLVWGIHHSLYDLAQEQPLTRRLIAFCARTSRLTFRVIYVSKASALQHEAVGYDRGRSIIIPNGFDCDAFRPSPNARERLGRDLGISAEALVIGTVARHHPIKNHPNLFHAVRMVAERRPVHLVLIGHGMSGENPALAEQLNAVELGSCTSLLGERADVPELVAGLDVFALSSNSEAFPQVLGEAMACGVPCVATDVGECRHVLGDTGLIVPPRDAATLAQAFLELSEAGSERRRELGAAARRRVVEHYALPQIVRRYESLYEQCVRDRGVK